MMEKIGIREVEGSLFRIQGYQGILTGRIIFEQRFEGHEESILRITEEKWFQKGGLASAKSLR